MRRAAPSSTSGCSARLPAPVERFDNTLCAPIVGFMEDTDGVLEMMQDMREKIQCIKYSLYMLGWWTTFIAVECVCIVIQMVNRMSS